MSSISLHRRHFVVKSTVGGAQMDHIEPVQFEDHVYAALKSAFSTVIEANPEQHFRTFCRRFASVS
jgi:hypothetical protein